MRGIAIALVVCAPAVASAGVEVKGWTADGKAVVAVDPGMAPWTVAWAQPADGAFWAVCTPETPKQAELDGGDGGCTLCTDATSCGLAIDAADTKPAMKSPNKKIKVKDKRKCAKDAEADGGKTCTRTVTFGKKGALTYVEAWMGDKAPMHVYFRPDSGAAVVTFDASGRMDGVMWSSMNVVDLSTHATYAFQLGKVNLHDGGGDDGNTGGDVKLSLAVTADGKTRKVKVEKISLYSERSEYGLGDPIVFDDSLTPMMTIDGAPQPDVFGADLAAAVKAHLPAGTVTALGVVDDGTYVAYEFDVYTVVVDAKGTRVVKQSWAMDDTEPRDETTLKVKL